MRKAFGALSERVSRYASHHQANKILPDIKWFKADIGILQKFNLWAMSVLFLFLMTISLSACILQKQITISKPITAQANESCIDSFDNFAFSTPDIDGPRQEVILPGNPWQIEASLPDESKEINYSIAVLRPFGENTQIWLQPDIPDAYMKGDAAAYHYLVYEPGSKTWLKVPAQIDGMTVFVDRLFVTSDGSLWGRNAWEDTEYFTGNPALSRYNEKKNRFEFDPITSQIPNGLFDPKDSSSNRSPNWDMVLVDQNDVFWIFAYQDAIYRYDPKSQSITRHASLADFREIRRLSMAPDGTIYFRNYDIKTENVYLQKGQIYQYFPGTEEIKPVKLPKEQWPATGSILADKMGRLWLGVFGWKDPEGEWKAFHPQLNAFIQLNRFLPLYEYYRPPAVIMESSDGKLWFSIPRSEEWKTLRSGIAWYYPKTNEGCWFSSEGVNVDEDVNQTIWLAAGGNLYRYMLRP